jgi:5-dehydro-2-deoxygluconokinase
MAALSRLGRNSFLVMGRVGMDLSPPIGQSIEEATQFSADMGGSAANIAAGLVRLGAKASLLTRVSDDAIGRFCRAQLARYGIGADHVHSAGGEARNSLALSEARMDGHQTVIYRNGAADFQMTEADVEAVDYSAFGALITAGTVFAAEPSRSAAFRAFDLARAAGVPIVFDVDYRPYSWPSPAIAAEVLSRAGDLANVIVGNDDEFGFMAGSKAAGRDKARALAAKGAAIVVYKMGAEGAVTFHGGEETRTGIYPVAALKPTGAGDSFMAGLMTALAEGAGLHQALMRGTACAAIVVSKPGCAPAMPDRDTLTRFLFAHPGPTQP